MEKTSEFDWYAFNQKIAGLRGDKWRKKLIEKKLYKTEHPTALKYRRVELGISQKEMLHRVGIKTLNSYGRIERAEAYASQERAEKIASVLNTALLSLFVKVQNDKYLAI